MRVAILLCALFATGSAAAQTCSINGQACPSPAAAISATQTPLCSQVAIPTAANVTNTTTETQFVSSCKINSAVVTQGGAAMRVDSRFLFGVSATVPTLQGKVYLARTASPALTSCVGASQCVVLLDTGAVAGLAAGQNLYANADVSLTFPNSTSVEAAGQLNFRTTATAVIAIGVTSATSTTSTALAIPWDAGINDTFLVYTATWGGQSTANFIQLRQQTVK